MYDIDPSISIYDETYYRDELQKISNVVLYGTADPEKRTSIVSFNIKNFDPKKVVEKLEKQMFQYAKDLEFEKTVKHYRDNIKDILISPFNRFRWSRI